MRYVDDLRTVKPEEIKHIKIEDEIQAIVYCPDAIENIKKIHIIWKDGSCNSYTIDGRCELDNVQRFIYKPKKVRKLKPLWRVLQENDYTCDASGHINLKNMCPEINPRMFQEFGKLEKDVSKNWNYAPEWFEEVEE